MNEIREDCEHKKAERKYWKYSQRINIVATSAACIAAVFTYGAYRKAARQAIVAQRALDISTRPWLFIEKIYLKDPSVIEDGKIKLSVKAVLKNYSQSPALGGELLAQIVQIKPGISYLRNETKNTAVTSIVVLFLINLLFPMN